MYLAHCVMLSKCFAVIHFFPYLCKQLSLFIFECSLVAILYIRNVLIIHSLIKMCTVIKKYFGTWSFYNAVSWDNFNGFTLNSEFISGLSRGWFPMYK